MKFSGFRLNAIQLAAPCNPVMRRVGRQIKEQRQIGRETRVHPMRERCDALKTQLTTTTLIGKRGVSETIAEHPVTAFKRGPDDFFEVLATRSKHQQRLGTWAHRTAKKQAANRFAQLGATRLPCHHHRFSACQKKGVNRLDMRAFPRAVDAFKRDELTLHYRPN